ncbi:MAG TPA: NAD(P)H-binding protein, partial [Geminicoccaceae bacterium]|nr:NAD(P)H-binding protein [Geminicoccaceae bacterium]
MRVFVTGATGYIGGSVAARLLAAGHEVRGLVRDGAKAALLEAQGIVPVPGSLDDADVLRREAAAVDAVVNAASSDHRGAVMALLDGLAGTGRPFVHTSGTSVVADDAAG